MSVFTDPFNRANSSSLGSDWDNLSAFGTVGIVSNVAVGAGGYAGAVVKTSTAAFGADQYAEITVGNSTAQNWAGCGVRLNAAAGTGYAIFVAADVCYLSTIQSGYDSVITSFAGVSTGDRVRIEAEGTTLRVKVNGATILSLTEGTYSSGQPGLIYYDIATTADDFEGGDLGVASLAGAVAMALSAAGSVDVSKLVAGAVSIGLTGAGSISVLKTVAGDIAIALSTAGAVSILTPDATLTPDGIVSNSGWSAVGAGTLYDALATGDSEYAAADTDGAVAVLSLTNPSGSIALSGVTIRARARLN